MQRFFWDAKIVQLLFMFSVYQIILLIRVQWDPETISFLKAPWMVHHSIISVSGEQRWGTKEALHRVKNVWRTPLQVSEQNIEVMCKHSIFILQCKELQD